MFNITSKREKWKGIRTVQETFDGYDWAPFLYVYRVWRTKNGTVIWKKLLAKRQCDQFEIIKWAFD